MRTIVTKVQSFILQGLTEIKIEDIKKLNYSYKDIFDMVCAKSANPQENYKFLMTNYGNKVDDVLASLGTELPEYINEHKPALVGKIPQIVIKVAHYQSQRVTVIDPAISMLAAVFECQMIINN
jgi:hypothetical protein